MNSGRRLASLLLLPLVLPLVLASISIPNHQIAPGVSIPTISIGTWTEGTKSNSTLIVTNWLGLGARGIDAAYIYFNQQQVAGAIQSAGVPREQTFITSKIPGCANVAWFIEQDLKKLNTSYIDLMLIHGPIPSFNCPNSWKVMEDFVRQGKLKAIGVSNFKSAALEPLIAAATIPPAVNQISHSVLEHDDETVQYCADNNITVEAYSPLGSPARAKKGGSSVFTDPTIGAIAKTHNVSAAQVALRWIVQRGHILTVLSENAAHQANDADVFGFELSGSEMTKLDQIQKK